MGVLEGLEPNKVFYYFEELCCIPHGSGNTKEISDYIEGFAKKRSLEYTRDALGNVVIIRPASNGYEGADTVMLQGHVDMVCEKNDDLVFDFKKSPLKLGIMDDMIYAKGTTLGGDDGIAVAYMLAILDDDTVLAPRLECVFTVDEEIGMLGAVALDASNLKARTLINLDNEVEGEFITSCAGGVRAACSVPVRYERREGNRFTLVVSGLMGGHSGIEIDKYRGNANIIMGRLLHYLRVRMQFYVISLNGGLQDNAIPREASADILVSAQDVAVFEDVVDSFEKIIVNEYRAIEKNIQIYCNDKGIDECDCLTDKTQERIFYLLNTLPDGVQRMSMEIPGLVQTSLNLGIIRLSKDQFKAISAIRSSIRSEKEALCEKLRYLTEIMGGSFSLKGDYPEWEFNVNSKIRKLTADKYEAITGKKSAMLGIHAGLECGIFTEKLPGLDVVSMGPDIYDIHTPKERLSISSVKTCYELLLAVLGELK